MTEEKLICKKCKKEIEAHHDYVIYVSRKDNKQYTFHTICIYVLLKEASYYHTGTW